MRKTKGNAKAFLLRTTLAAGALAFGVSYVPEAGRVEAASDNSAHLAALGDVESVDGGQEVVQAMSEVGLTTYTTQQQQGIQLTVDLTPVHTDTSTETNEPTERTVEVYLSENYNADYELYEFGFNNKYFFYSNVGNGAITDEPVKIEIPANIQYSMEREGVAFAYMQNTEITMTGSYVLKLTVSETDGLMTTHYVSYYRFRIMEARPETEVTEPGTPAGDGAGDETTVTDPLEQIADIADLSDEELEYIREALLNGDFTDEELFNDDGSVNEEAISAIVEARLQEEIGSVDDIYQTEGVAAFSGIASVYDYTTGLYLHTLISGHSFYTDIQNGGLTRQAVTLRPTTGLEFIVYKDGELYEEEDQTVFSEPGSYMLIPTSEDVIYLSAYEEEKPVFTFRIIGRSVNDLSIYHAPEGFVIDSVYLGDDDLPAASALMLGPDSVLLREDGEYRIRIHGEETDMDITYVLDRVRPRFSVDVQKNVAEIGVASQDVVRSIVYRNEQPYATDKNILYKFTETGTYWYYLQDEAGNVSGQAFTVKYGFNAGSVIAILLVIGAIAGMVIYIRYLNKHTKVR